MLRGLLISLDIFKGSFFPWLGEFSFSLFLGHGYWSRIFNDIPVLGELPYSQKLFVYLIIAVLTGLAVMYISKLVIYGWNKNKSSIRSLFVNM